MHRVLLSEPLDGDAEARLAAATEVIRAPTPDEQVLCDMVVDCDALVVRTSTRLTRRILESGRRLRVVGVAGVGLDRVDVVAAAERGITVLHTPAAASDAVAELTVAFMLQLLRPIPRLGDEYRAGRFAAARAAPHGRELRELTVGVVGFGRIGSRVGRALSLGFGATVLYNDILPIEPVGFCARAVEKDVLWRESDVVTLHVPLTTETRRLVDERVLACFKPGARLINTARGAVVDTDALTAALRSGRLAGAALDVTEPEPLPVDHPLWQCAGCILTPHIAARTEGGLRRMNAVVDEVIRFLAQAENAPQSFTG